MARLVVVKRGFTCFHYISEIFKNRHIISDSREFLWNKINLLKTKKLFPFHEIPLVTPGNITAALLQFSIHRLSPSTFTIPVVSYEWLELHLVCQFISFKSHFLELGIHLIKAMLRFSDGGVLAFFRS